MSILFLQNRVKFTSSKLSATQNGQLVEKNLFIFVALIIVIVIVVDVVVVAALIQRVAVVQVK